jgi:hypothetical protein
MNAVPHRRARMLFIAFALVSVVIISASAIARYSPQIPAVRRLALGAAAPNAVP